MLDFDPLASDSLEDDMADVSDILFQMSRVSGNS